MVTLMKAIEAGCDMVDTAVSSLSLGPGHNPTESLVEMLEGTGYETRINLERVERASSVTLPTIRPRYREFFSGNMGVDTAIFKSQIPGGMISNMENQLKGQGASDRLHEVLEEVPRVRKDCGYPPLVTPSSQIVGSQAVFNVLDGQIQSAHRRIFRPDARAITAAQSAKKIPTVLKMAEAYAKEAGDYLPPRRSSRSRMGASQRTTQRHWRATTAPMKMY